MTDRMDTYEYELEYIEEDEITLQFVERSEYLEKVEPEISLEFIE